MREWNPSHFCFKHLNIKLINSKTNDLMRVRILMEKSIKKKLVGISKWYRFTILINKKKKDKRKFPYKTFNQFFKFKDECIFSFFIKFYWTVNVVKSDSIRNNIFSLPKCSLILQFLKILHKIHEWMWMIENYEKKIRMLLYLPNSYLITFSVLKFCNTL